MLASSVELGPTAVVEGYARGSALCCRRIVHITGCGEFRVLRIESIRDPCPANRAQSMQENRLEDQLNEGAGDEFAVENTPSPFAAEQTWPTNEELMEADQRNRKGKKKRA